MKKLVLSSVVLGMLLPVAVFADDAMRVKVINAITADPRSAQMSPDEINALAAQMEVQAAEQRLDASDVTDPAPQVRELPVTTPDCNGVKGMLCAMNSAFGFDGQSGDLPFVMWMLAGICFMLLAVFELRMMRGQWHWLTHDPRYK